MTSFVLRGPGASLYLLGEEPGVAVQPVERKFSAIFASDIAGYSRLMSQDEVGTLARLKACRVIIDGLIATHRGRIFNTAGDSVIADFASAVDAVACAVAVQNAITTEEPSTTGGEPTRFRIGVHVGDVMVDGTNLLDASKSATNYRLRSPISTSSRSKTSRNRSALTASARRRRARRLQPPPSCSPTSRRLQSCRSRT
jgi:hypothetical protein